MRYVQPWASKRYVTRNQLAWRDMTWRDKHSLSGNGGDDEDDALDVSCRRTELGGGVVRTILSCTVTWCDMYCLESKYGKKHGIQWRDVTWRQKYSFGGNGEDDAVDVGCRRTALD